MQRVLGSSRDWPLHDTEATRLIEHGAQAVRPAHALMQRAGEAVARLALAIAPHARRRLVYAGPGNNGGDGLEAAMRLQQAGHAVELALLASQSACPTMRRDRCGAHRTPGCASTSVCLPRRTMTRPT